MSNLRDEFCKAIKEGYPAISGKADMEYSRLLDDHMDSEYYSYSWFEALANALNKEMCKDVSTSDYSKLFAAISTNFDAGDEAIKKCIDVAFVENLFWQVPGCNAGSYWEILPKNLRALYVNFHNREPL